jgi:type IV pilus assembly protein PilA
MKEKKTVRSKEVIEIMKKNLQNENKGFSLVELIVAIAIMAVLVAVLAPALLQYVERSRAQKDDSAMGEVANAIQLALSDQDVYDEMLYYVYNDNYSCYTDGTGNGDAVSTGANVKGGYIYVDDDARVKDEITYIPDGKMRGVTITFAPDKGATKGSKSKFVIANGHINNMNGTDGDEVNSTYISKGPSAPGNPAVSAASISGVLLKNASDPARSYTYMYNQLRSVVGDEIPLTSQTYRNSCYTVFIKMGTTGGEQPENQDAIKVYGQWNGTNLDNAGLGQNGKVSSFKSRP